MKETIGAIEVREVHPSMLPAGHWFWLVPASLAGRPTVLTSDVERLRREVAEWNAKQEALHAR